ncbi:E3 ubiquitin ligase BIG BROTHER-related-like isoform X3 [Typha latifolia]|uniref:E3 ubiquitin ligase BIG BROTHER-related-like isoform X3 n=2 Tax=Typha latifolia TaxID=4733 RepID=UPI003C2D4753
MSSICSQFEILVVLLGRAFSDYLADIMGMESDTTGKHKVVVHYVNSPVSCVVEENFGGYFDDLDDVALAEVIQDQECVYQSFQRNVENGRARASNSDSRSNRSNHDQRRSLGERSSSRAPSSDPQLAADEAFARDLQELENQMAGTSIGDISRMEAGMVIQGANSTSSSSTSNSGLNSASTSAQVAREDDIDPDSMSYEELQQLGEAIGTQSRGLSEELIQLLPSTTYRTGLFSKKEKTECVICRMVLKNRDKLITLPCQHQYHKTCITEWLKISKACPICTEEVFGS